MPAATQRYPARRERLEPFLSWDEWPDATREFFKAQRTPAGEDLILEVIPETELLGMLRLEGRSAEVTSKPRSP